MKSMTGYGRAETERDGRALTIELKSVNHRYLDLSFRMPRTFMFLEDAMRKQISEKVARGHMDVFVTYRNLRRDARTVNVDRALFDAYAEALGALRDGVLTDDRTLMRIAGLPDVMTVVDADEDQAALRELVREGLDKALCEHDAMRIREGERLKADLALYTDQIERMTAQIEARYPETVAEYTSRLRAQIEELVGQNVDETRLMTEVAIMADRSAIAEETVRLHSHISQLRACLEDGGAVGRRLDFLVQELNREVNTISSKSQDIPITRLCVDCKGAIEKLREQLQNVE